MLLCENKDDYVTDVSPWGILEALKTDDLQQMQQMRKSNLSLRHISILVNHILLTICVMSHNVHIVFHKQCFSKRTQA